MNAIRKRPKEDALWIAIALVAGAIDYWGTRYNLNPDGISYLEMAQHAVGGAPHELVNGLWSPGYPGLLMLALGVVRGGWEAVIPALHAVNLLLYVMTLGLFLRLLDVVGRTAGGAASAARHGAAFGAMVFATIALESIGIGLLTPDFGVMLCVLATAACCIQLERAADSGHWPVVLGLVLGVGYWMKGVLLPLNALLLAGLLLMPPRIPRPRAKIGVAALVFAMTAMPLIVLVSSKVGRPTPGEVGRLNYAWQTNGVTPYVGWTGDSPATHGVPLHPPRIVQAVPKTVEFATPIRAHYPLWYDPSYWYAGLRTHINVGGQWRVLTQGVADLGQVLLDQWLLVAILLALALGTVRGDRQATNGRMPVVLAGWAFAATVTYSLVHVEARYLAGFMAVSLIAAWRWLSQRRVQPRFRWVMMASIAALVISLGLQLRNATGGFDPGYRPGYLVDADSLHAAGLVPGDRVATVGDAFESYAELTAGTPIAAQVLDSVGFWNLTPASRADLSRRLGAAGVKALVANDIATAAAAEGWHLIVRADSSNLGVLLIPR